MIFLRTQSHRSFDRRFVFTALHQRFICIHLFYSYLTCPTKPFPFRSIPSNHLLSTKRRFVGSACTAPTEDLPPSYLQHWSTSLFELINGLSSIQGTRLWLTDLDMRRTRKYKHNIQNQPCLATSLALTGCGKCEVRVCSS